MEILHRRVDRTLVVWTESLHQGILTRVKTQFALRLPVEFRRAGTDLWLSGYTENMGSTAVVFRATEGIEPYSRIEMVFRLPVPDPCDLICSGTVLRVDLPNADGALSAISATIERYSFVRP